MSNIGDGGLSAAIQSQLDVQHHAYMIVASCALLVYDYLLTVDLEAARYWGTSRMTLWTLLFYLNRYGAFLGAIPALLQFTWISESPHHAKTYHQVFVIGAQSTFGAILIMRTYALYDRSRFVLAVLLCVSAGVIAFGGWAFATHAVIPLDPVQSFPRAGCPIRQTVWILGWAWLGILVFDSCIVAFTIWKALHGWRSGRLLHILVRDGVIYFLVLAVLHSANIASLLRPKHYFAGVVTTPSTLLSSVMTSRFMLNLRDPTLASPATTAQATMSHALTTVNSYAESAQGQARSQTDETGVDDRKPPHSAKLRSGWSDS